MREKPVSKERVIKYVAFLESVNFQSSNKFASKANPLTATLSDLVSTLHVSSCTPQALEALKIIKRDPKNKKSWEWIGESPSEQMALQVLDYLLHKNKKTVHFPIPELAELPGIAQSLKTITDRLAEIYVQQQKSFKSSKNASTGNSESDLFRIDDQRVYIAGQIACHYFESDKWRDQGFDAATDYVIKVTDILLSKLRNK